MEKTRRQKGVLTIEASISYTIFLMVIVTVLYIMRIVYVYGLVQHAAAQTARELSMYSYLYQVAGLNDLNQQIAGTAGDREAQFDQDMSDIFTFYEEFSSGNLGAQYSGTTDPKELLKNIGGAVISQAGREVNHQLFELAARPLLEGYIGADSQGNGADSRLRALRVVGGMSGLNLNSSSFFEDGQTVDLIICYTVDPIMPIDILPELNLVNRAYVRGMSGNSVFTGSSQKPEQGQEQQKESVWDLAPAARGKAIREQEQVRNLPDKFATFSAYDAGSQKATAELTIDIRDVSYQDEKKLENHIRQKCKKMDEFERHTEGGVTLEAEDIKKSELIIYIPSSVGDRQVDRSKYDRAVSSVKRKYPNIRIVTKEID